MLWRIFGRGILGYFIFTTHHAQTRQAKHLCLLKMNPLTSVRVTCNNVATLCSSIRIDDDAINLHADKIGEHSVGDFFKEVQWDAQGWHYCADVAEMGPLTVQYIFVMDALNFCFWPSPGFEYDALAMSLKQVLEADSTALDAEKLATISEVKPIYFMYDSNMIPCYNTD